MLGQAMVLGCTFLRPWILVNVVKVKSRHSSALHPMPFDAFLQDNPHNRNKYVQHIFLRDSILHHLDNTIIN